MHDPRPWMQAIISLMVTVAALYALVIIQDAHLQQWASGALGSVTTFWLTRGR
jgi:hypothetical protein